MPLKFRVNKDCSSITDDKLLRQVPEPDRSAGEHVHQAKGGARSFATGIWASILQCVSTRSR
jgi:hypothetical protein